MKKTFSTQQGTFEGELNIVSTQPVYLYILGHSWNLDIQEITLVEYAGGGGGGINYSLNEQDTGLKWIDGRTIYQRTLYFSNPISGDAAIDLPLGISGSEMDYIISKESIAERWDGGTFVYYAVDDASPVNQWAGGSFMIYGFRKIDGIWNVALSNGYFIIKNLYLTIRYVKPSS